MSPLGPALPSRASLVLRQGDAEKWSRRGAIRRRVICVARRQRVLRPVARRRLGRRAASTSRSRGEPMGDRHWGPLENAMKPTQAMALPSSPVRARDIGPSLGTAKEQSR
jgi:hypothetical protein